jgi:hypothetical protein
MITLKTYKFLSYLTENPLLFGCCKHGTDPSGCHKLQVDKLRYYYA